MVYFVLLLAIVRGTLGDIPEVTHLYNPSDPRMHHFREPPRPGSAKGPPLYDARGVKVRMPPAFRDVESPDFEEGKGKVEDLYDLEQKITRAGKWPEFLEKVKETGDRVIKAGDGKVMKNWEENALEWADWAGGLTKTTTTTEIPTTERNVLRMARQMEDYPNPSPGMSAYWGKRNEDYNDPEKALRQSEMQFQNTHLQNQPQGAQDRQQLMNMQTQEQLIQNPQQQVPQNMQSQQQLLQNRIPAVQLYEKRIPQPLPQNMGNLQYPNMLGPPAPLGPTTTEDPLASYKLPKVDDFAGPIRWVRHNSVQIKDGLAKVTDPDTGVNRNYNINGTLYVPIPDDNMERLGFSTEPPLTASPPKSMAVLTTDKAILRTVAESISTHTRDVQDWLIFEISRNMSILAQYPLACQSEVCKARCQKNDCEAKCSGDTCSAGCVGPNCDAYCSGSGCLSMCIGEQCRARCEGMTCDSRCIGKDCQATCSHLSCFKTVNGVFSKGGGTWDQNYPQYGGQSYGGPNGHGGQQRDYDEKGQIGRDYGGQKGADYGGHRGADYGGQRGADYGGPRGRDYGGPGSGPKRGSYRGGATTDYGGPNAGDYGGPINGANALRSSNLDYSRVGPADY